jgi:hypothetical protein
MENVTGILSQPGFLMPYGLTKAWDKNGAIHSDYSMFFGREAS